MGEYEIVPRQLQNNKDVEKRFGVAIKKQLKLPSNSISSTKYTFLTFIPKNLFEQFHRFANIYFVFICIVNFIPQVDAISPFLSLVPVICILAFTSIKDAVEDYRRHLSDVEINSQLCLVKTSEEQTVRKTWDSLKVGDIIQIGLNEEIPADCLLISSSNDTNICFLETANLDGETNLKQKDVVDVDDYLDEESPNAIFPFIVHTDKPNPDLTRFKGYLVPYRENEQTENSKILVKNRNVLYRGCVLRNTDQIEALIIYGGKNTKAVLSNNDPPSKTSYMERLMNRDVIWCVVILLILCMSGAVAGVLWERDARTSQLTGNWYIPSEGDSTENKNELFLVGFYMFLRMVVLLQILIPLSLYITIEIVKLFQAFFISNDLEMYSKEFDAGVVCRSLNITEELGNIQAIFSDKTGTLTENQMIFRAASVNGINYEHAANSLIVSKTKSQAEVTDDETQTGDPELRLKLRSFSETDIEIRNFFLCLACCNSVVLTMEQQKEVLYESESPDEAALVYASKAYGVTLMARSDRSVKITWPHEGLKTFKCKYVLPFDSSRKMMSVILEDPDEPGGCLILTKGADSAVFARSKNDTSTTKEHVDAYAEVGLRTLCAAYRKISQQEALDIVTELAEAEIAGDEEALSRAYSMVEKDLTLVGATAIEDRLQDGVEESIKIIREAKIKLWVLTGDKIQTAVEVGRNCNLIKRTDHLKYLTQDDCDDALQQFLKMRGNEEPDKLVNSVLIISGSNLEYILANEMKRFIKFCSLFGAVLCCRTTPKLKGEIVAAVRHVLNLRSLSIGDGANDVTMIQEANIGVGISGHEGRQAVMASDYAMPRFRMLPRLLLVHGHWNYARIAQLIEYFFYKNALFILLIFIYQGFSGWSGANFIPDLYLILFMLLFNSIPPIINATLDRFLPSSLLMNKPSLYQFCAENKSYQPFLFWVAMLDSILQASVQFFIPYGIFFDGNQFSNESTISVWTFGTIVAAGCLLATFLHLGIDTMSWTWAHVFFLGFSYSLFLVIGLASNALPSTGQNEFWIMEYLFSDLWSWLTVLLVGFLSVLPRFIIKVFFNTFAPSPQYFSRKKHYQSVER
ncbi:unnamed protein product [Oikopleura dioica]|uniref:Phospholipid-transporting ATPase n=1 Tax=Oikopleura dioica TaxID=34765 RepID=E4WVJ2_OIKDI|nr:unnamed protein product [Oikopleura dioica]